MSTHTFTSPHLVHAAGSPPNPDNMRAIIAAVRAAFVAVGWQRTADTGQVDPATLTYAAAGSAVLSVGFEVWEPTDDLQATHPIRVKIEYGVGYSSYGWRPLALWITVGKGSDGAGTITDILIPRTFVGSGSGNIGSDTGGTPSSFVSSGDGSMLALVFCPTPLAANVGRGPSFILDRSRDSTNAPTGDGVVLVTSGWDGISVLPLSTVPATSNIAPNRLQAVAYTTATGTDGPVPVLIPALVGGAYVSTGQGVGGGILAPVFPWTVYPPGVAPWQVLAALSYAGADNPGGEFQVRTNGTNRTYLSFPITNTCHGWGLTINPAAAATSISGTNHVGLAVLWE